MPRTTAPAPAGVDPDVALEEALAARAALERRLVDGDPVDAAAYGEADHRVGLAQARVTAAATRQAEEEAAAQQAAIDMITADLSDGHLGQQARRLVELHDQAATAIAALHAAATEYVAGLQGAADQLWRVDRASAMRTPHANPGELVVNRAAGLVRLADGRRYFFGQQLPVELVAEAAGALIDPYVLGKAAISQLVQRKTRIGWLRDAVEADGGEMTDG